MLQSSEFNIELSNSDESSLVCNVNLLFLHEMLDVLSISSFFISESSHHCHIKNITVNVYIASSLGEMFH